MKDGEIYETRMKVYQIDPLTDARWSQLLQRHPRASVFHSVPWLETLRGTYGYEPVVFTTSPPHEKLRNGLLFCRVDSWLTGSRLVSLPFSDHCEPLCDSHDDAGFLLRSLQESLKPQRWKYLEMRTIDAAFLRAVNCPDFHPASAFSLHIIDLSPEITDVFRSFDYDSVQRRIKRGDRAGLIEQRGRSDDQLRQFYALFELTRSRHHLPPIPFSWFQNLIRHQSEALEIRLAYIDKTPISAILTLRFKGVVYYKYGCSDRRFNRYGATPWLLWRAIADAKSAGMEKFDLGRTERDNVGLLTFKNNWVSNPQQLIYWRFPGTFFLDALGGWKLRVVKQMFSLMLKRFLRVLGELMYRHIG